MAALVARPLLNTLTPEQIFLPQMVLVAFNVCMHFHPTFHKEEFDTTSKDNNMFHVTIFTTQGKTQGRWEGLAFVNSSNTW